MILVFHRCSRRFLPLAFFVGIFAQRERPDSDKRFFGACHIKKAAVNTAAVSKSVI